MGDIVFIVVFAAALALGFALTHRDGDLPKHLTVGQVDYYGQDITADYVEAIDGGVSWRDVFDEHSIDWVLIRPDSPLAQVLTEASNWVETYRDDTAVVYVPA